MTVRDTAKPREGYATSVEDNLAGDGISHDEEEISKLSLREARAVALRRWILFVSTMLLALPFYLLLLFVLGRAALGNLTVSSALLAVLTAVPTSLLIAARATAIDPLARRTQRLRKADRTTLEELIMSLERVTRVLVQRLAA
jgi:hypothetical protein